MDFLEGFSSYLEEVLTYIQTIQKCTATYTFKSKLSADANSFFNWASDFLKFISNDLLGLPAINDLKFCFLISFAFYLGVSTFLLFQITPHLLYIYFTVLSLIFTVAMPILFYINGPFYIKIIGIVLIYIFIQSAGLAFIKKQNGFLRFLRIPFWCTTTVIQCFRNESFLESSEVTLTNFIFRCILSLGVTNLFALPVMMKKDMLNVVVFVIEIIIIIIISILYKKFDSYDFEEIVTKALSKIFLFANEVLIIPIINNIVNLCNSSFGIRWQILLYVCAVPLLGMLVTNILLICFCGKNATKYRDNFHYVEIYHISSKFVYALFGAFDCVWACVAIELVSMIVCLVFRPYRAKNLYALVIGESIITIIANLIGEYYDGTFPTAGAIILVLVPLIPVIVSAYMYIFLDSQNIDSDDAIDEDSMLSVMYIMTNITLTVGPLLYGLNAPILSEMLG